MKYSFIGVLLLLFFYCNGQDKTFRNIPVHLAPYTNCNIYLASYYGNRTIMADTALLDVKSMGVFKGKRKLTPGMYFVVSPNNNMLFELMLDSAQHFSINADTAHLNEVAITGSDENTLFKIYASGIGSRITTINTLNQQLPIAKNNSEKLAIQQKQLALGKDLQAYKDSFIKRWPKSMLALLLTAGKQPEIPAGTILQTRADTIRAGQYIKKHYWDDVPFNDDRLLYTSFFEPKIDTYFKYYVSPVADSVIKDLQYLLLYARTGKEMYPYLLMKFTNKYFNPDHVGQNKVFLYLFNEFFMKGDTTFLDPRSKKLIFDRAYALMANQVGDPAPPLDLSSITDGKHISLYTLQSTYTLIVFWDPDCVHCQKELPRIDSIYRSKWKALGFKIYSVNINTTLMNKVNTFAREKNLSPDWIHTYQTENDAKKLADGGGISYFQSYDISETPTLYLLDAQKHIIAKRLNIEQIDQLIKMRKKAETTK